MKMEIPSSQQNHQMGPRVKLRHNQKAARKTSKLIKPNIVDHVIQETFMKTGNFTSKYTLTSDQALEAG